MIDPRIFLNKFVIGGALIGSALAYHFWVVDGLEDDLAKCRKEYTEVSAAVEIQNAEIARWEKLGIQYGKLISDATKENAAESKRWAAVYSKIKDATIPVDCDGAVTHLKGKLNEVSQEWNSR